LKKGVDRKGLYEYHYKEQAIRRAATALARDLNPEFIKNGVFVPIPPSKAKDDPLYDDRMSQIIQLLGPNVDLREVVEQRVSMLQAHLSFSRPNPDELYANYRIVQAAKEPAPSSIAIVDDLLTSGSHFKAMQRILSETYPDLKVYGLFLARRVPGTE
jgi:predicted amidophosphoribosyltransferase